MSLARSIVAAVLVSLAVGCGSGGTGAGGGAAGGTGGSGGGGAGGGAGGGGGSGGGGAAGGSGGGVGGGGVGGSGGAGGGTAESGLEAQCRRYKECGGTTDSYATCVSGALAYWGTCTARRTALDQFGACMAALTCAQWSPPDAYNPNNTPCASKWVALMSSPAC